MKHLLLLLLFLVSAIAADAQLIMPSTPEAYAAERQLATVRHAPKASPLMPTSADAASRDIMERPRVFDNWSLSFAGGIYFPMYYEHLKYLMDCSGLAGTIELRKQLTPIVGLGLEADGNYRMMREERKDPRTVIGVAFHLNLMNLFGGYNGRPRTFEMEALVKPAWGHLYRGTHYYLIPDEDYFATKYGLDFNFNLGRARQWVLSLRPSITLDVTSKSPTPNYFTYPYKGYDLKKTDLNFLVGTTYRFRGHDGKRHFRFAEPVTDREEVERLNEVVNFLRDDVEARDRQIRELKQQVDSLRKQ